MSEHKEKDEIEVTEEMIEAGLSMLVSSVHDYDLTEREKRQAVIDILAAVFDRPVRVISDEASNMPPCHDHS